MYKVEKPFKFAYDGIRVKEFAVDDTIEDGDECLKVALKEKWVRKAKRNETAAVKEKTETVDESNTENAA